MLQRKYNWYVIIMVLILPSLVITWYSYPCQDDFAYAYHGGVMMAQGYNLLTMSMAKVVEWYGTFVGAYTSTFLGYFFSGIINCNIGGIRVFEFCSAIIFYFAFYEVNTKKKTLFLIIVAVLGFLGSGGTLSISALCCVIYFLGATWRGVVRRQPLGRVPHS